MVYTRTIPNKFNTLKRPSQTANLMNNFLTKKCQIKFYIFIFYK